MPYAINALRENVRTTRDILPRQVWELVNEYALFVSDEAALALRRQRRFEFLEEAIARSQQLTGLIESTMLRDHALRFVRLGQLLERADMTSRIVAVATDAILAKDQRELAQIPLLLSNLLRSLSAASGYRRKVGGIPTVAWRRRFCVQARSATAIDPFLRKAY